MSQARIDALKADLVVAQQYLASLDTKIAEASTPALLEHRENFAAKIVEMESNIATLETRKAINDAKLAEEAAKVAQIKIDAGEPLATEVDACYEKFKVV